MTSTSSHKLPEFLSLEKDHALYRPVAVVSFAEGLKMVNDALHYCVETGIRNLLLDATGLTGFAPPTLAERFYGIEQWANIAAGKLKIAELDREEQLDPTSTNVVIAGNRGLQFRVFTDEQKAIEWLVK